MHQNDELYARVKRLYIFAITGFQWPETFVALSKFHILELYRKR